MGVVNLVGLGLVIKWRVFHEFMDFIIKDYEVMEVL